jgi:MSHA biogenesis protein MshI
MRWITGRKRRQGGWLALVVHDDEIDLVHVRREVGGTPRVLLCDSYRKEESNAATLTRLAKELKLERYRCTTLLGRDAYQLHQVDAPNVPAGEMKQAVRWRVKDLIDYPLESATIDVLDIPADTDAPSPGHVVYAVTAPNAAIERCAEPFTASRVALGTIDIPELAQRNVAALYERNGAGVVTLAFHRDDGLLTFTRAGELYNSRRIDVTLPQLLQADDARRTTYFERIALEVQRSLDHLGRQYHYVPLLKVLLGPLPAELRLNDYLSSIISVPVESIDLSDVLDLAAVPELKDLEVQSRYVQAIGAALRDEEAATA